MKSPTGTITIQEAAKVLRSRGTITGPCLMFRQLRRKGILQRNNLPYQQYINNGWFRVECGNYKHPVTLEIIPYTRTFISTAGLKAIERILNRKTVFKINAIINLPDCVLGF